MTADMPRFSMVTTARPFWTQHRPQLVAWSQGIVLQDIPLVVVLTSVKEAGLLQIQWNVLKIITLGSRADREESRLRDLFCRKTTANESYRMRTYSVQSC